MATNKTKLPCGECKGRCCSYPAFSKRELKTVLKKYKLPKDVEVGSFENSVGSFIGIGYTPVRKDGTCGFLINGACSVYDLRPRVCRIYGEIDDLPCEYVYPEEAKAKHDALMHKFHVKQQLFGG